jgi:hypothetical protein
MYDLLFFSEALNIYGVAYVAQPIAHRICVLHLAFFCTISEFVTRAFPCVVLFIVHHGDIPTPPKKKKKTRSQNSTEYSRQAHFISWYKI